jgi:hypothetical protein
MIEPGVGEFAFAHRSLQEYLAGRYLLNVNYPAMAIAEHLADTHWREPILLALGHASMHSNLSDFEKLLDNILSFDPARSAFLPSATMLLADAYFEIAEFPERVRLLLFERLFSQYCSVPGELAPFSRFVEEFFSSVWGRSAIDSNEELAVEDLLVRALSHGDQPIALRAATLVHQCRIYSNSIAEALVAAQRIDSPELQWSIHRFLHVLVSRGEIESHLRFTPITRTVTDLNLNPELVEGLREVAQGMRILEIPPGRRKMRQKVQQLALSNLHFRTYLLEHPELAARNCGKPFMVQLHRSFGHRGIWRFRDQGVGLAASDVDG